MILTCIYGDKQESKGCGLTVMCMHVKLMQSNQDGFSSWHVYGHLREIQLRKFSRSDYAVAMT